MLRNLNIRNMILIDSLDLSFDRGLCVLTGETGTGKSILLDALGCALGWRTNVGMLKDQSIPTSVTAEFEISNEHVSQKMLSENGVSLAAIRAKEFFMTFKFEEDSFNFFLSSTI